MTLLYLCRCTWAFSSCRQWGLRSSFSVQASHCGGFSCCKAWALGLEGSAVVAHGLSCLMACGFLVARPMIEPVFPALAGGFLSTMPPGKSLEVLNVFNTRQALVLSTPDWPWMKFWKCYLWNLLVQSEDGVRSSAGQFDWTLCGWLPS